MIQINSILAMLLISQGGGRAAQTPYVGPHPRPEVEKLIDEGSSGANWEKNLKIFEKARDKAIQLEDVCGEGRSIFWIARSHEKLGKFEEALPLYFQALVTLQEAKDLEFQAYTLRNIAGVYSKTSRMDKSLENHNLALRLFRQINDWSGVARTANDIGLIYRNQGQPDEALNHFLQALPLFQQAKDTRGEAAAYNNIGDIYSKIGQPDKALRYYDQALRLVQSFDDKNVEDKNIEAAILNNIGLAYSDLGKQNEAMAYFLRALSYFHGVEDSRGEAFALHNLGGVYMDLHDPKSALYYYERALPIHLKAADKRAEATTLMGIGLANELLDKSDTALEYYDRALHLYREVNDRTGSAVALSKISRTWTKKGYLSLGIIFAKQSVILTEEARKGLMNLKSEAQESFVKSVDDRYRQLADMLIGQGRVMESQQVLSLLKEQQQNKLLNQRSSTTEKLDLTPYERDWIREYEKLVDDLSQATIDTKVIEAVPAEDRTQVQKDDLASANSRLAKASHAFQSFLASMKRAFKKFDVQIDRLDDLSSSQSLGRTLKKLPDYAAIYTLVTEDHVRTLVAVPNLRIVVQAPVKIPFEQLSQMIINFRIQLQNPSVDPRVLGAELYDLVVRPIEKVLKISGSKQTIWSLDSVLRYVPIWALYDKQEKMFFIEKYPSSIFTPRTVDRLAEVSKIPLNAAGFGVTKSSIVKTFNGDSVEFGALTGTRKELEVLNQVFGTRPMIDDEFTSESFSNGFRCDILHVATHFRLVPGDEDDSVLVMGNNQGLSLKQFKELPADCLSNVDLLVLSACDTGVGTPNADGSEFEGLALLAQQKGAGAVMASLWPVNDDATSKLMADFYTFRKTKPDWSKVQCLREAQLRMIRGENKPGKDWVTPRGTNSEIPGASNVKPWPKDEPAYKHPYFWAPFVITGNVR